MPEFTGKIVDIKLKQTAKGSALAYMLETKVGNNVWFMVWGDSTTSAFIAPQTTQRLGLNSVHFVDQEITVEAAVRETKDQEKKPGKKIAFIDANPKLVRAGPVTPDMKARMAIEYDLSLTDNKRLGAALLSFYADHKDRIEPADMEFISSLAQGAQKYHSVRDKQREFVAKLLAKYAMRVQAWRKTVEASLKVGGKGFEPPKAEGPGPDDGQRSPGGFDNF